MTFPGAPGSVLCFCPGSAWLWLQRVASALERDLGRATVSLNFENSSLDGITDLSSHTGTGFSAFLTN